MPFKFWKREKGKEKGEAEAPEAPEEKPKAKEKAEPAAEAVGERAAEKPPEAAQVPAVSEIEALIGEVHAGLVDLGLTIPATKGVFAKRVDAYPGGSTGFAEAYRKERYRATTRLLGGWLGFHAPAEFDPEATLKEVNLRLSSFKLAVKMSDLNWLDQELSLRKARLAFEGQEKVVRFKDARDFVKGINELLTPRKIAFLELETWSDEFAFMLVREPRWDKLAATDLVIVKAPQTAVGGECGECGAPVGSYWHDCLSCGAVFSST